MLSSVTTRGSSVSIVVDGEDGKTYDISCFSLRSIDLHLIEKKKGIKNGGTAHFMDLTPESQYTFNLYPERRQLKRVIIYRKPSQLSISEFQIFNGEFDITKNGNATQSSNKGSRTAGKALDGNDTTYSETLNKNMNKWIFNFIESQDATLIVLKPQPGANTINGSYIQLYDQYNKIILEKRMTKKNIYRIVIDQSKMEFPPPPPPPVKISKIFISKKSSAKRILSIAEVRLFNNGVPVPVKGGKATQSTTYNNDSKYAASKALDNNNRFNSSGKSITSSKMGREHWWNVSFSKRLDATEIKIYNNTDALVHLEGSILTVYDENNSVILEKKLSKRSIQTYSLV